MNRRAFITLLAGGAGIVAAEPVRRIWVVGAALEGASAPSEFHDSLFPAAMRDRKGARFAHLQGRWHDDDLLQGYPGAPDDFVDAGPRRGFARELADEMRDALPTTFPVDPRVAKTLETTITAEDIRRMARDLEAQNAPPHPDGKYRVFMPPSAALFLGGKEVETVGPIVIHTEIWRCRS